MTLQKYISRIESFKDKKIILTGGTSGIGLELLKILIQKEAKVVLLVRNIEKASHVKETIIKDYPNADISFVNYDQSDYELIDSAVKEIKAHHSDFDVLVCNAGIMLPPKEDKSKQGFPLTIDTNFLGLKRFLDQLVNSFQNKRFVLQGSLMANAKIKENYDIYSGKYPLFKQYNVSKACVESLFYYYLNNNLDNEFILTEPGVAGTDIIRYMNRPIKAMGWVFMRIFSHSAKKASLTLLLGLTSQSKNGSFIVPRGLFAIRGYPKYKKFPNKRKREFLINKVK